jgi:3-hydroxyisobutyrate dehydrogenase-like beta-hydroxyacid dehydrogenase
MATPIPRRREQTMRIGVLGMGRMGRAITERLLDGDLDVVVWNRTKGKARELVARGATEVDDLSQIVSRADVVITSLSNDDAVRETVLADDGVRSRLGDATYVDCSTVSPRIAHELDQEFDRFVAMPILGAPQAVRDGRATYLAGESGEALATLGPLLFALGGKLRTYDRPELAAAAKVTVNLLLLSGIATLAEALAVGRAGGLDDAQLVDLLTGSPLLAPGLPNRMEGVVEGSGPPGWTTELAAKDAVLAVTVASSAGTKLWLAPLLVELYRSATESGSDDEDMVAVARNYVEREDPASLDRAGPRPRALRRT